MLFAISCYYFELFKRLNFVVNLDLLLVDRFINFKFMKQLLTIFILVIFSKVSFAQKPTKKSSFPSQVPVADLLDEKQEFQNARSHSSLTDRIAALQKFTVDFPKSESRTFALELIVSTRAELGDQKLRLSDNLGGITLFKSAVTDAPSPISDKLFSEIIVQLPTNLYFRDQRKAADEIAKMIEEKISGNANQLLDLAAFYLGTENGFESKRLAKKVIEIDPQSASAYQTLGFAERLNFDLEASAASYAKALELSPDSAISKRSLAEMKRATGKTNEAILLFQELLAGNPKDSAAENGLVLSLFNADKQTEAESAMAAALESNPNNFFLLVGAAYWYAAHQQGAKAIENAEKAINIEPRYSWAYIALGRGLIQQKRPLEAERVLLTARQYGNFPTLNYELASARLAAGFYREAADELKKSFEEKDGVLSVNLGGRILKQGKSFTEILSFERLASIFEPVAADDPVAAGKLKSLLKFSHKIDADEESESEISNAADEFVAGEDRMKIHRGLFVVNRLLEKKVAVPKAIEITESVIGQVDTSLDIPSPSAAVMADALYETRTIATLRNELLVVPDIPRQTLTRILRGRIQEMFGWALLQQQKPDEAAARFRQAIIILPEKSFWWRESKWRLGDALELAGNSEDALKAYIDGYNTDAPEQAKRLWIEIIYAKVNGSLDGLDRLIGANHLVKGSQTAQIVNPPESPLEDAKVNSSATEVDEALRAILNEKSAETNSIPETKPVPVTKILKSAENVTGENSAANDPKINKETSKTNLAESNKSSEAEKIAQAGQTRPLFESIVINVPGNRAPLKKDAVNSEPVKEVKADTTDKVELIKEELETTKPPPQIQGDTGKTNLKDERSAEVEVKEEVNETESKTPVAANESVPLTISRPRIVGEKKAETSEVVSQCKFKFGQDNPWLLNDGGSLGMFVGFEGTGGDPTTLRAVSHSPNDIEIEFQPDVGVLSERAFFIFKSISTKTGKFTVTFDSNCGKQDVTVSVR